jgi:hypothetical protein
LIGIKEKAQETMRDWQAVDPNPSEQARIADGLPRFREVIEATSVLRPVPPVAREAAAAARRAFLNEAARIRECRRFHPGALRFQFLRALAPVAGVLILLASFLGGAVAAARSAAPDSVLYPAKLAWEDVRLVLAADAQARAELAATFVETRVAEIASLAAAEQPVPEAVRFRLEAQLQQALRYAAQLADAPMNRFLVRMQVRMEQQVREMRQAMAGAPEQQQVPLRWTVMVLERTREMAAFGEKDPTAFRQVAGREAGFAPTATPTATKGAAPPAGAPATRFAPTAPATVGQGSGPGPSQDPGPRETLGKPSGPTPRPTDPASPTPEPTPGPPGNTPGPPGNTPGPPGNTPGQPGNTPGGGRPPRP